jgi:hypothetical protein
MNVCDASEPVEYLDTKPDWRAEKYIHELQQDTLHAKNSGNADLIARSFIASLTFNVCAAVTSNSLVDFRAPWRIRAASLRLSPTGITRNWLLCMLRMLAKLFAPF